MTVRELIASSPPLAGESNCWVCEGRCWVVKYGKSIPCPKCNTDADIPDVGNPVPDDEKPD